MQQLEVHIVRAERETGLGDSSIWKLLLASPLPRDVPQGHQGLITLDRISL